MMSRENEVVLKPCAGPRAFDSPRRTGLGKATKWKTPALHEGNSLESSQKVDSICVRAVEL
jgi:hypothetical protein